MLYSTFMDAMQRAMAVLAKAESSLRDLLGAAAQEGEYAAVLRITEWARSIGQLVEAEKPSEAFRASSSKEEAHRVSGTIKTTPAPRGKQSDYPKFTRSGDELIMLAWSKRKKKEY